MSAVETKKSDPWEMTAGSAGSKQDFQPCTPGVHRGVIVGLFDVGFQTEYNREKNQYVEVRKVILIVELAKKRPDGSGPFVLANRYTWSMRDNSNFYKMVTNVLSKRFAEGEKFSPLSLIGKPVMAAVSNTQNGEKTYHNLDSLTAYPEDMPEIEPIHTPISWSVQSGVPFPDNTGWLPWVYGKTIYDLVKESAEWRRKGADNGAAQSAAAAAAKDKEIPF